MFPVCYSTSSHFCPFNLRKLIADSLAYGTLRYGITVFGNCSELWRSKVNSILKGILRNVYYNPTSSSLNLFHTLDMPTFQSLFLETVVLSHYWNDDFKTVHPNPRQLRALTPFLVPAIFTRYGKNQRSFYVPHIFNSLPEHLSGFTSRKKLRKALRHLSITEETL